MSYLYQYLLFLAQAVTIAAVVIVILSAMAAFGSRRSQGGQGQLAVTKLNEQLDEYQDQLRGLLLDPDAYKAMTKAEAKAAKAKEKAESKSERAAAKMKISDEASATASDAQPEAPEEADAPEVSDATESAPELPVAQALPGRSRLFVVDFEGDVQASKVGELSRVITALLTVASREDEVLVRVESPGGLVHAYGLAASQLARIRSREIPLTVAVDKVAASGGYMMAAVADQILSAPFAVLGSIGVVAQVPNVHRLLKNHDVDVEVLTAGKYKRTLTVIGENTEEGRQKFLEELEVTHALFQEHVSNYRPSLDIDAVSTGEAWYGQRAIDMKLVDRLMTSDDYLMLACQSQDVYLLSWRDDKKPIERLFERVQSQFAKISGGWLGRTAATPGIHASSEQATLLGQIDAQHWSQAVSKQTPAGHSRQYDE